MQVTHRLIKGSPAFHKGESLQAAAASAKKSTASGKNKTQTRVHCDCYLLLHKKTVSFFGMGVRSSAFIITTYVWPRGGDAERPGLKLWRQNHTTPRVLLLGSSLKRSKENNIDIHSAVHNQMNVHFTDETLAVRWANVWNMSAHPAAFEGLRSAERLSKHE